jgi:hypothetical protein
MTYCTANKHISKVITQKFQVALTNVDCRHIGGGQFNRR